MCTLITGDRSFGSLVGVTAHEMAHTWFQQILATNESKHEWMDEGFTSFVSDLAMNYVMDEKKDNPFEGAYKGYMRLANSEMQEPLTTQADRYSMNAVYGISAYSKGEIFLSQLGYIIGQDMLQKTLQRYYDDFKFTHPTPNDIIRTAEKVSGMQLWWYLNEWAQTTHTIDYGIKSVEAEGEKTRITLERIGKMPMPLDILVKYKNGVMETYYAPLRMMRGEKENPYKDLKRQGLDDWPWVYPEYSFSIDHKASEIEAIYIDPSGLMADTNRENNTYTAE
jgi:aminopeptidase N